MSHRTRSLYEEAIRRYNAGDVEGFVDAHAEDAVLVTPSTSLSGHPALRTYWSNQRVSFPDLALTVGILLEHDDVVASEWTWRGTNTGPLRSGTGAPAPATGMKVQLRGMEIARFRNGKIAEYHMYWDGVTLARQLGVPIQR